MAHGGLDGLELVDTGPRCGVKPNGACPVRLEHPIDRADMEVRVAIERRAEAVDERHRTASGMPARAHDLVAQMALDPR